MFKNKILDEDTPSIRLKPANITCHLNRKYFWWCRDTSVSMNASCSMVENFIICLDKTRLHETLLW